MTNDERPGWTRKRLDELGFVGRGKSRHRPRNDKRLYGGPYPFVQTADIMAADPYINSYSQTYSDFGLQQSRLWPPETLCMTIAGANTARTAILKIEACFPDSVVGFIPDPLKADLCFVKYSLDLMRERFLAVSRGATQDNLSLDKLLSFPILAPSISAQRRIAAILSAYDDLIENNTRRIKIQEEMAQALYREWFVHFRFPGHEKVKMVGSTVGPIPQGWQMVKLGSVADVNALSIKNGDEPEQINYIDISSVSPGRIDKVEHLAFKDAPGRARRIVRNGDVVWSTVRPNRRSYSLILDPLPNLIVSTGFAVISAKGVPFSYIYFALTTDDFVGYLTNHARGSAYPAVNGGDFEGADFVLPCPGIVADFHNVAGDVLTQCQTLIRQNANLRRTRDLLLPKLISGEIDVSNLEIS